MGRSPHGERGLKSRLRRLAGEIACRSPHGERGLKSRSNAPPPEGHMSLSSRRAWIEIVDRDGADHVTAGRSPHGERGLKFLDLLDRLDHIGVALLTESVD